MGQWTKMAENILMSAENIKTLMDNINIFERCGFMGGEVSQNTSF